MEKCKSQRGWTMLDEERCLNSAYKNKRTDLLKGYLRSYKYRNEWGELSKEECIYTARMLLQKLGHFSE
jgi:hypothetical protein